MTQIQSPHLFYIRLQTVPKGDEEHGGLKNDLPLHELRGSIGDCTSRCSFIQGNKIFTFRRPILIQVGFGKIENKRMRLYGRISVCDFFL